MADFFNQVFPIAKRTLAQPLQMLARPLQQKYLNRQRLFQMCPSETFATANRRFFQKFCWKTATML